jgi:PLD-like domain
VSARWLNLRASIEDILAARDRGTRCSIQGTPSLEQLAADLARKASANPADVATDLLAGLEDACWRLDRVSIAVTGLSWLGSGVPSVEQEMNALVRSTRRELCLCAYSMTQGALRLLVEVGEVVSQGASALFVINRFMSQPRDVQVYLEELATAFPERCRLLDFVAPDPRSDLHAKILVVDRAAALVGSANLSFHGMVSNHEMAVVVRGPAAELIASRVDMLAAGPAVSSIGR